MISVRDVSGLQLVCQFFRHSGDLREVGDSYELRNITPLEVAPFTMCDSSSALKGASMKRFNVVVGIALAVGVMLGVVRSRMLSA